MPTFPSRTYAYAAKSNLVNSDLRKQVMSQSTPVDKSAILSSSSISKEIRQHSKSVTSKDRRGDCTEDQERAKKKRQMKSEKRQKNECKPC